MKILYLTMDGFDTPGPNNQMAMVMIREFLRHGHRVHLIQSRRQNIFPELPEMLLNYEALTVDTVSRRVINKTNFIIRYLDELKWAFQSFAKWRKIKDVDVVFLQSCPTAVFQLILLKIFSRKPVLFNVYDVWPGHVKELGILKSRFLYFLFQIIQKIAYSFSTKVLVLSEDMKQKLYEEGVPSYKISIVPPWYDDNSIMKIKPSENRFLQKYMLCPLGFTVQFAGTIGYVFNYKIVLDTAELLINETNIRFQMIGDGAFKENFVAEAQERGLTNIDFYPLQPVDMVPDVYSACDIALIPLRRGVIGNGVPSKAPLLMACHKVIVNSVEEDSVYFHLFNDENMGVSVPVDDAQGLADAIRWLSSDPQACSKMADRAEIYSKEHYSSSVCTKKIMSILEEIVEK